MAYASVTPIASGEPALSPEALLISALIGSGEYVPDKYQVLDHYFTAHKQVHEFCKKYQEDSGKAPTVNLVRKKFKTFPYLEGVEPAYAARELKEHWQRQQLLKHMSNATSELRSEDFDVKAAYTILQEGLVAATVASTTYATFDSLEEFEDVSEVAECPVSLTNGDKLEQFAGRMKPGNLWYVVADTNIGKSWMLMMAAIAAAEAGWDVWFYSTEMSRKEVQDRLHMIAFRDTYKGRWADLTYTQRADLAQAWQSTAGHIYIHTAVDGPLDATVVAGNHAEGSIAIIDYIGHMYTTQGRPAGEDHSIIASISTELKRVALAYQIPILCAAQLNREGARAGTKASALHVAGSYQIGRDADVLIALADPEPEVKTRVRQIGVVKNRHGSGGHRWYHLYDIDARDFRDITYDQAQAFIEADTSAKSINL